MRGFLFPYPIPKIQVKSIASGDILPFVGEFSLLLAVYALGNLGFPSVF